MKKTDKKSTKKKTSSKSVVTQKTAKPSPLEIKKKYAMGRVETSAGESIEISLICNVLEQKFLAVQKQSKTKDDSWYNKGGGIWIPFKNMKELGNLIMHAHNEGLKAGWDIEDYIPQPMDNLNVVDTTSQRLSEPFKLKRDDQSSQIQILPFEN